MPTVADLKPESFRVQICVKVVELFIKIEGKNETTGVTAKAYEYLVGDETSCIILNTKTELKPDSSYELKNAYTQLVDGYIRLCTEDFTLLSAEASIKTVNTKKNRSYISFQRRSS